MQEISRAIQRVYHPDKVIAFMFTAFFSQDSVVREGCLDDVNNFPLSHAINLTGIIIFTFLVDLQAANIIS